jgi:hypothetical protein
LAADRFAQAVGESSEAAVHSLVAVLSRHLAIPGDASVD